jgi:hypothetical protein
VALRQFTDPAGRLWQVWETVPETPREERAFRQNARLLADAARVSEGREDGWLTFMTENEKRRLSPIPPQWAQASDTELADHLARAERVSLSEAAARVLTKVATQLGGDERPGI